MKKIILSIIALIALLGGSGLGIYYFVDINNYKSDVTQLLKEQTGNEVFINGDMRLRILPDIALDISRISMPSTSGGRSEDAIYIRQLIVHLKILPLFRKQFEISSLKMIGPEVKYIIFKDGTNNFSKPIVAAANVADKNLKPTEVIAEQQNKNYASQREFINNNIIGKFNLGAVKAESGKVIFTDERKGIFITLKDVALETSITPEINPVKISANLEASAGINIPFELGAKYQLSKDKYEISAIEMTMGVIKTHGELITDFTGILPEAKVTFYFEDMDISPYADFIDLVLDSSANDAAQPALPDAKFKNKKTQDSEVWSNEPINFMALRNFNANLNFKSNKITYKNNNIGSITIYAYLINGKLTFSVKEAELFGGNINSETTIDITSSVPKIKYKLNLEEVDLALMPENLSVANKFTGKVNGGTMLTSSGSSQKEIIGNMSGDISLKAENGAIKNIDLVSMARNISSAFNVGNNKVVVTNFKEMSGDFDVEAGVLTSENLQLTSEVLDFNGHGTINVGDMSLNLMVTPKLKLTKDEKDILGGIKAPIIISGTISQPNFRLEIQNLVEDLIKNPKATENLVKQLKRDFKDIKNNMKNDEGSQGGGVFDDLKNILQGF